VINQPSGWANRQHVRERQEDDDDGNPITTKAARTVIVVVGHPLGSLGPKTEIPADYPFSGFTALYQQNERDVDNPGVLAYVSMSN